MKKIIALTFLFFLSACFWWQENREEKINETSNQEPIISIEDEKWALEEDIQEEPFMEVVALDDKNFIEIIPLENNEIQSFEVQIRGKVLDEWVDKIEVHFENNTSDFPEDDYTLPTFKWGEESFRYFASAWFRVLDFWENYYTFTAYKWEETSSVEVIIFIPEEDINEENKEVFKEKEEWNDNSQEGENEEFFWVINTLDLWIELWESDIFGKPISLSGWIVSYENDTNLKIYKEETPLFSCQTPEKLNEYLFENYSWVYWNTCRNIVYTPKDEDTKGIYFNVLFLDEENYFYERHYVDFENEIYWVYLLETWIWVDKTNIAEKNQELKQKEFNNLEEVNTIFEKVLQ